jgi:hypothetical protein
MKKLIKGFQEFITETSKWRAVDAPIKPELLILIESNHEDFEDYQVYKDLADLGLTERNLFIELSLLHQEKPEIWGKPEISWDQAIIVELKVSELPALPEFHYDDDSYEIYEDTVRLIINKHGRLSIIGLYKNPYISIEDLKSPNFELGPLDLFEAIWKYDGPIKITGSDSLMKAIHSFNSAKGLGDPFGVVTDEWSHD